MSDEQRSFPCNQCGECCRRVHLLKETAALDRGDGTCVHFDEGQRTCRIYDERPDICRVDRQYETIYRQVMSWAEFSELNQAACRMLQGGDVLHDREQG
ncbi:YkgJ family cysteine cluster protein [Pseudomonas sp. ZM23]|uniref:YkgJ family cysteine cluster protein n=1 Tax=Pseudomonas triclosanedens TaxID=2961893 RepID=A0ABY7A3W0_9PSED|nr:YkgJ family cysteine cluster protein [Pseudomonas triclosanedens]MCP8465079.1 YkgJ family cysteine cluster protein [Pseudomonas triclosanedens]MCP8470209.1 YkgJ family cysteine cluster protein [Pseudomonas triclosanedens]MCP8476014.1 YkgJ family cysteine cluster protein [Pseudomonas triclosanedens]WAI51749.1 YkgJ family cysteine cluster protein [Pseudomonas triclosanedens]